MLLKKEYIQVATHTIDIYTKKNTSPYTRAPVHGPHDIAGLLQINQVSIITRFDNEIFVDRQADTSLNGRSHSFYGIYLSSTTCKYIIYILDMCTLGIYRKNHNPP
jgi:hypothetical protein